VKVIRRGAWGNVHGGCRYLGSCGCGCGWQFASTHEPVVIVAKPYPTHPHLTYETTWRPECVARRGIPTALTRKVRHA
jgi:hypothetical protein